MTDLDEFKISEYSEIGEKFIHSKVSDYLSEINEIAINQFGNPSHADIFYLEPSMMMTNEEITPKVALRIFSKILFAKSKLLIPWMEITLILTTLKRFKLTTLKRSMLTTPKRSMLTT